MAQGLVRMLREKDREFVLKRAAAALSAELRQTAFVIAVDAAFADGRVEKEEAAALDEVRTTLEISDQFATKVVEVIRIKNRG